MSKEQTIKHIPFMAYNKIELKVKTDIAYFIIGLEEVIQCCWCKMSFKEYR